MSVPISRTVRLPLDLLERAERVRARVAVKACVDVDLRAIVERAVLDGLDVAERRLGETTATETAA